MRGIVTIHREYPAGVFMHLCMKIRRHASKNSIAAGDFKWIFARNFEGTEQLREFIYYSEKYGSTK